MPILPRARRPTWFRRLFAVSFFGGISISIATLWYQSNIGASIMVFMTLYWFYCEGTPLDTISMRGVIIYNVVSELVSLT